MSSTATTSRLSSSAGPSASSAPAPPQSDGNNSVNFYRNLFYILIGLLAAFAAVAALSLFRNRYRRKLIHAEATRLGLLAPGMPGYISIRDRRAAGLAPGMRRIVPETQHRPDWWEVGAAGWMNTWVRPSAPTRGYSGGIPTSSSLGAFGTNRNLNFAFASKSHESYDSAPNLDLTTEKEGSFNFGGTPFRPLAIIPPQSSDLPSDIPLPVSNLKYFPRNLAYRPEDLLPPPLLWGGEDVTEERRTAQMEALRGEMVDVVTMIRMPEPERSGSVVRDRTVEGDDDDEDEQEVLREWGGVCLGVVRFGVEPPELGPAGGSGGNGARRSTGSRRDA